MLSALRPRRSLTLPFLVVTYPAIFSVSQLYPDVFLSPTGILSVSGILIGAYCIATVVDVLFGLADYERGEKTLSQVLAPSRLVVGLLAVVFVAFVGTLVIDAAGIFEGIWQPLILPISFFLFAPVWLLYGATFALAGLFSLLAIPPSPIRTTIIRIVMVVGGFGLSAVWQTVLAVLIGRAIPNRE